MKRAWLAMAGMGAVLILVVVFTEVREQRRWHQAVALRHLGFTNGPGQDRQVVLVFTNGSRSTIFYIGAASAVDTSGAPVEALPDLPEYQPIAPGAATILLLPSPVGSRPWQVRLGCSRYGLWSRCRGFLDRTCPRLRNHLPARWLAEPFQVIESGWIQ